MPVRRATALCVLLLSALAAHAAPKPAPKATPKSLPPLFARLALPPDGVRVLPLVFQSSGPSKTYDVLYLDTNGNGKFDAAEKHVAPKRPGPAKDMPFYLLNLPLAALPGVQDCQLTYGAIGGKRPSRFYALEFTLSRWLLWKQRYTISGAAKASADPQQAPLLGAAGKPAVTVEVRPDRHNQGHSGFGVVVGWPKATLGVKGTGLSAHLVVTDAAGKIVHQGTQALSNFGFG